jgi:hypothetical protein
MISKNISEWRKTRQGAVYYVDYVEKMIKWVYIFLDNGCILWPLEVGKANQNISVFWEFVPEPFEKSDREIKT